MTTEGRRRTMREVIEQADELAARFEEHEPDPTATKDAASLRAIRKAFRVAANRDVAEAVATARANRHSWTAIAMMLGKSGETARQEYGREGR